MFVYLFYIIKKLILNLFQELNYMCYVCFNINSYSSIHMCDDQASVRFLFTPLIYTQHECRSDSMRYSAIFRKSNMFRLEDVRTKLVRIRFHTRTFLSVASMNNLKRPSRMSAFEVKIETIQRTEFSTLYSVWVCLCTGIVYNNFSFSFGLPNNEIALIHCYIAY